MPAAPEGFISLPGKERVTATAVVFDVQRPGGGASLVCKRLGSRAVGEAWVRARLVAEGELLRGLGGRGTPRLVAAGQDEDGPWMVMERVDGRPLAESIGAAPAAPDLVANVARSAFATLEILHARGIVHADLNPDNVLVSRDGRAATILDFGLALWPGAPAMPSGPFRGTPAYAAPEVARGEALDARADLFGLAATLLHVASGQTPRPQEVEAAVLLAAGEQDLRPWAEQASKGLPGAVASVLVQCCSFSAAERPTSAAQVCAAIREL
jgi:eukaryotic-like serine/threonine-protein kinase